MSLKPTPLGKLLMGLLRKAENDPEIMRLLVSYDPDFKHEEFRKALSALESN